jgi:hypothetical protein
VEALSDIESTTRLRAVEFVGQVPDASEEVVSALATRFFRDPDTTVRTNAATALNHMSEVNARVVSHLQNLIEGDDDFDLKRRCLGLLAILARDDSRAKASLLRLVLVGEDEELQAAAAEMVEDRFEIRNVASLRSLAVDPTAQDEPGLSRALRALEEMPPDVISTFIPQLIDVALNHEEEVWRVRAAETLRLVAESHGRQLSGLEMALDSADAGTRLRAVEAIGHVQPMLHACKDRLVQLALTDSDAASRAATVKVLCDSAQLDERDILPLIAVLDEPEKLQRPLRC